MPCKLDVRSKRGWSGTLYTRVEKPVIGADFSEHVGEANRADEKVLGRCSAQERNVEGQMFA